MWTTDKSLILLYALIWNPWISKVITVQYEEMPDQLHKASLMYEPQISQTAKSDEKLYADDIDPREIWEVYKIDSTEAIPPSWSPEFGRPVDEVSISPQLSLRLQNNTNFFDFINRPYIPKAALSKRVPNSPYDNYDTVNKIDKRQDKNKMQVFHLLGIFSRRLKQARQQKKQHKKQEEKSPSPAPQFSSSKARKYNDSLRALAYTSGSSNSRNESSEDSKRTIFISQGWAPSGRTESRYKNEKPVSQANIAKDANMYAFTSNHWGPLGKRSKPTFRQFPNEHINRYSITNGFPAHASEFNLNNEDVTQLRKILYINLLRKIIEQP